VSGHKRGFVVELVRAALLLLERAVAQTEARYLMMMQNGERWRGLKLHFVHDPYDFKISRCASSSPTRPAAL